MRKIIFTLMLLTLAACASSPQQSEPQAKNNFDCPTAPGGGPMFSNCQ